MPSSSPDGTAGIPALPGTLPESHSAPVPPSPSSGRTPPHHPFPPNPLALVETLSSVLGSIRETFLPCPIQHILPAATGPLLGQAPISGGELPASHSYIP